ncbi:hypothetical protein SAMD00079811_52990 [Scytonema sp. HK-05]|nr:hypothetical protein SAMD00079811_52990 [Scytonema sp. HK-05]
MRRLPIIAAFCRGWRLSKSKRRLSSFCRPKKWRGWVMGKPVMKGEVSSKVVFEPCRDAPWRVSTVSGSFLSAISCQCSEKSE